MNRSLKFRVHEWAADRFSWVQYPHVRAQTETAKLSRLRFANQMPLGKRIDIALFSAVLLLVAIAALVVVGTLAWAFISPMFGL